MARIVFDLDGTLIDSAPDIQAIANALLADEGLAPVTLEQVRGFIGNGTAVFIRKLRAARGIPDSEQARFLDVFHDRYDDAVRLTHPYPGVVAALEALRGAGHRLGICTNKPLQPTHSVLNHLGLDRFFDTVWGGNSLPVSKPDPAPLHAAFDALSGGPCLYVGDSEVDAETAVRADIPFLLFTEGYRKSPVTEMVHARAFSTFAELPVHVADLTPEEGENA